MSPREGPALAVPSAAEAATPSARLLRVRPQDTTRAAALSRALNLHPLVARVLVARDVGEPGAARAFLAPRLADLTQPDAMADRDVAAARLARAVQSRERVAVFGDYDVDGTTSAALLASALRAMGAEVVTEVASRFDGGYGLSDAAAARVRELKPKLLVTLDCGTSDHARLAALAARGIETIVVDHHKVPDEPLPALAFLNPHRADCGFPYKGLASVGLALSVAAAVRARLGVALDLRTYLDLVAVGTVADVAPLTGDNRILVRTGLERLAQGLGRPGMKALLREARVRGRLRAFDVGFSVAPMLNAPGRLGAATATLELLLAGDAATADTLVRRLVAANEERRRISAELLEVATTQVYSVYGRTPPPGIVVGGEGWHPGVGGIVAARLSERFGVPAIVVALAGALGTGSARGPRGWALFDAVSACGEALEQFGGHDGAAGMTVRRDRLEALRGLFADACRTRRGKGAAAGDLEAADCELTEGDLDPRLAEQLEALEPTGQALPEPLVLARGVRVVDASEVGVGHLRARMLVGRRSVGVFVRDGVARRQRGELGMADARSFDVLGHLRPDAYAGAGAVQIGLVAMRAAG